MLTQGIRQDMANALAQNPTSDMFARSASLVLDTLYASVSGLLFTIPLFLSYGVRRQDGAGSAASRWFMWFMCFM